MIFEHFCGYLLDQFTWLDRTELAGERMGVTGGEGWWRVGKLALFEPLQGEAGKAFAQYPIPGELEVFPEVDGAIEILADISVRTVERVERRVVRFSMAPKEFREVEAIFLPAEIVRGFGEKDPRAWETVEIPRDGPPLR